MKTKILITIALTAATFGTGCMSQGKLLQALSKDPAIVSVRVGTPWGVQQLTRVGGSTNSVTVTPDGTITVNSK